MQYDIIDNDTYNINEKKFAINIVDSFKVLIRRSES